MHLDDLLRWLRQLRARHRPSHLFARSTLLERFAPEQWQGHPDDPHAAILTQAASCELDILLTEHASSLNGIDDDTATEQRCRWGPNEIAREHPPPWWLRLVHCATDPFNLLLTLLATIAWLTHDLPGAALILVMVALSTGMRFWQEQGSHQEAEALRAMVKVTATVLRPGEGGGPPRRVEVGLHEVVPGDVVTLSAGDLVPADARLLQSKDLYVSQAAMTGESQAVEKHAVRCLASSCSPLELPGLVLMGSSVVSGTAQALVFATGERTWFGAMARQLCRHALPSSTFEQGLRQVSMLLVRFMAVMTPVVFVLNLLTKANGFEALLFSLSVAVGLTPEMLPVVTTTTLARGAVMMSRHKVIVKRLDAIQAFGTMDVLCTDKTGTLTENRVELACHVDAWGNASHAVLELAWLNSYHQTGLKSLLDLAVLQEGERHPGLQRVQAWSKVDEIPFDFVRRRMSVVVTTSGGEHLLVTKGAIAEVLAACTHVMRGPALQRLTPEVLADLQHAAERLDNEGLRVVAVASRAFTPTCSIYSVTHESELVLAGYVAFCDPPKESAAPAILALRQHGVKVRVLTGDNERVAAKVCRDVGLLTDDAEEVIVGGQLDRWSDAELAQAAIACQVFARLTPAHKERIVRVLRGAGHVVGFLGDGINDAAALRAADVGVSVDTAVDIAREAADLILLEKSLMVVDDGVIEGRRTFANLQKYIRMTASSSFGNVFSVLVASAWLPFLPMLPTHLLVQNLLYDLSQTAIPFDHVDPEQLERPRGWHVSDLERFMLIFGPISSVFDLATFGMMWFVLGARTQEQQGLFQAGWFVVGVLTQTLVVHMLRTARWPLLESRASAPLTLMTLGVCAVAIGLTQGKLGPALKLEPLPPLYFALLPLLLLGYASAAQAVKHWYLHRYGWP